MKSIETKYGRRVATCADSIQAAAQAERGVLAPLEPMTKAIKQSLNQKISKEAIEKIEYNVRRIDEFISKWRASKHPTPGILYIQPNWVDSIDKDTEEAFNTRLRAM